ncbi:PASTA domain-containing protein [Cellulomonas sp. URHE0023]|uniref:protein kinase domain-containing protein n=1 Tax=Cellulomonas sp. URHE0023 TaxID=1380354 RepID=UPI00047FFDF3|nr:PASTA domain-containing protein [Cellulomonas sp. URHE0023]
MTVVGGRYRLGRLLGSGGSADVHAAVDELLDRPVAVKVMRVVGGEVADPGVRAAARLRHPNIAAILDAGRTAEGRAFVVLELVDGMTIDAILGRAGAMTTDDALTVVGAVLDALAHAHAHGVLHLDLSPSNVMVAVVDGEPQPAQTFVLDLAGSRAPAPGDAFVIVSPEYAAPEIATATAADERSDVYSAGALLYLLLTGHPPFERSDPADVLRAQVGETAPRPSDRAPAVPAAVDRIVARALAKDPATRFASARAMRAAVGDARSVLPIPSPRPASDGRRVPAPSSTKRLPVVAARSVPPPTVAPRRSVGSLVLAVLLGSAVVAGLALLRPVADDAQGAQVVATSASTTAPVVVPTQTATEVPTGPAREQPRGLEVPALVGLDVDGAQGAVEALGLLLAVAAEVDASAPRGTVLGAEPSPGSTVPPGSMVHVTVASGLTTVPSVQGEPADTVSAALDAAGLVRDPSVLTDVQPAATAGTVLRSVPPAGARVPVGSPVRLVVAAQVEPDPTPTPTRSPVPSAAATADPSASPTPGGAPAP